MRSIPFIAIVVTSSLAPYVASAKAHGLTFQGSEISQPSTSLARNATDQNATPRLILTGKPGKVQPSRSQFASLKSFKSMKSTRTQRKLNAAGPGLACSGPGALCVEGYCCACNDGSGCSVRRLEALEEGGRRLFGAPASSQYPSCYCSAAMSPSPPPSPSPSPSPPVCSGPTTEIRDGSTTSKANYYYRDCSSYTLSEVRFHYDSGSCPGAVTSSSPTFGNTCPHSDDIAGTSACERVEDGITWHHSPDWTRGNPGYCIGLFVNDVKIFTWTAV